jgi:hypothetical protein
VTAPAPVEKASKVSEGSTILCIVLESTLPWIRRSRSRAV